MAYPNLEAELKRYSISREDVGELIDKSASVVSSRLSGSRGDFLVSEAQAIRDKYFTGMSLDYLFSNDPITPERGRS